MSGRRVNYMSDTRRIRPPFAAPRPHHPANSGSAFRAGVDDRRRSDARTLGAVLRGRNNPWSVLLRFMPGASEVAADSGRSCVTAICGSGGIKWRRQYGMKLSISEDAVATISARQQPSPTITTAGTIARRFFFQLLARLNVRRHFVLFVRCLHDYR